ncbi:hypothetical protein D3C80_736220 [compost metagenome]
MFVIVGRDRRAIAHLEQRRHRFHGTGQQQGQGGRAIGRVAGLEVIGGHAAIGVQAAVDFHQLRGALGLPHVFLFAGQLHPHRALHRTRQQHRVGAHVIGAVAAITAGCLHANDLDACFIARQQPGQVCAQQVRVLRT